MKTPEEKRREAMDRANERSRLTPEEQLAVLDTRRGGSVQERARLQLAIASRTKEKKVKKEES